MKIAATAYTIDDVLYLKKFSIDIIRFGEPDCFFRAIKNWDEKTIALAIDIIQKSNKQPQFQFLQAPTTKDDINYLLKIANAFPDLPVVVQSYGFITRLKNQKKLAKFDFSIYNLESLKMLSRCKINTIILPKKVKIDEIVEMQSVIKNENLLFEMEYCFYGREQLMISWQCFLRTFLKSDRKFDTECAGLCNELLVNDLNNPDLAYSILGNTVVSSQPLDNLNLISEYCSAGVTQILLDFRLCDEIAIENSVSKVVELLKEYESEKRKDKDSNNGCR